MIIVRAAESAEEALADGWMRCPRRGCGDTLQRWGHGRRRRVRGLGADTIDVRPRRVRCRGCGATQVLLPAALQPRRADSTEVIGTALARKANGLGHRQVVCLGVVLPGLVVVAIAARYKGYRYPIEVLGHAVWLYHRFGVSRAWKGVRCR